MCCVCLLVIVSLSVVCNRCYAIVTAFTCFHATMLMLSDACTRLSHTVACCTLLLLFAYYSRRRTFSLTRHQLLAPLLLLPLLLLLLLAHLL
jgi:hypothetical protein